MSEEEAFAPSSTAENQKRNYDTCVHKTTTFFL